MTVDVDIFRLVDPPAGQEQMIRDTLELIEFPWWRCIPALRRDPDGAVLVQWSPDVPQNLGGLYKGSGIIEISTRYGTYTEGLPSILAHECGHMVDNLTLTFQARRKLLELFHASPGGWDDNPHVPEWHHTAPHPPDVWSPTNTIYQLRPHEAFADAFVAAFAPAIWAGRAPRFAHWTTDLDTFRHLILEPPVAIYDDVDPANPHAANINRAAELGLMAGVTPDRFDPHAPVTRAQLATVMVRLHDRLKGMQ